MYSQPTSAILIEYVETVNKMLNQYAQNSAAAGEVQAVRPIVQIGGKVLVALSN
jgi:hypothetical protein